MERSSDPGLSSIRNDVKGGVYVGPLKSHSTSRRSDLEKVYKVPDLQHSYTKHPLHRLTVQYTEICHNFLASHGVDKQLGPQLWNDFVKANTPHLTGFIFASTEAKCFLWLCKFIAWVFAWDSKADEGEWAMSPDKLCDAILDITTVLLWNDPEEKRILRYLKPLQKKVTTAESRARVQNIRADVVDAKKESKSLMDIKLDHNPLASAFRDLWIEYIDVVPAEFASREADGIQDYLSGCLWESHNRQAGKELKDLAEFFVIRRMTSGVSPYIVCTDLLIARHKNSIPQIPNRLFDGPQMQSLLQAITDIVGWHNDIYSFAKELKVEGEDHNMVKLLWRHYNCASYTEAGELGLELLQNRIAEMEHLYEELLSVSAVEFHPAIDMYIATCRDWISGTHQWHLISSRYNASATSV